MYGICHPTKSSHRGQPEGTQIDAPGFEEDHEVGKGKQIAPKILECIPENTWILASGDPDKAPVWPIEIKTSNVHCLKDLNLWQFVTPAIQN